MVGWVEERAGVEFVDCIVDSCSIINAIIIVKFIVKDCCCKCSDASMGCIQAGWCCCYFCSVLFRSVPPPSPKWFLWLCIMRSTNFALKI